MDGDQVIHLCSFSTWLIHGVKLPGLMPCLLLTHCMILDKLPNSSDLQYIRLEGWMKGVGEVVL